MGEDNELMQRCLQEVTLALRDWCKTNGRKRWKYNGSKQDYQSVKTIFLKLFQFIKTGFSNRGTTYIWDSLWHEFVLDKN